MDTILLLETPTFEFPKGVLCHILSFIDTQQRLTSCSRVSHAWHEAAASATTTITASQLHEQHVGPADKPECPQHQANGADTPSSLALWLHRHGSNLTQLTVIKDSSSDWGWRPWFSVRRRLEWPVPWQQLSQLRNLGMRNLVVLDSSSLNSRTACCCQQQCCRGGCCSGSLAELCKLTSLTLRCCSFSSSLHSLGLARLTQLRHLELYSVVAGEGEDLQPGPACAAVVAAAEARLANQQEEAPPAELAAAAGAEEEHAAAAPAAAEPAAAEQEEVLVDEEVQQIEVDEEEQQIEAQEWWEPEDEEAEIPKAAVHFPPAQFLRCGLGSCLGDLVQLTHLYVGCLRLLPADVVGLS
uniref:F-box domain-containing protein n=1 Tax=Tetradesmus obliquus TaxID=3088 RepID=A0A383VK73_TETOB|eukprot:jgi/Sobl393_1/4211/SZX65601.1